VTHTAFAPAKVNLYLHVTGRRPDGYHLLDSLVAFADIGDHLTATPAARLSLEITGPEAAGLDGLAADDNLVLRAARRLAAAAGVETGAALRLGKHLPVAAGIGGGSSDAAAALKLLTRLWQLPFDRRLLLRLGAELGADVPACLLARPVWVGGIGERLAPAPPLPRAGILLSNPRHPLATAAVFAARRGRFSAPARFTRVPWTAAGLALQLAERGNGLTKAAISLVPEIADLLGELTRLPGALLARMSGSGATCFALFPDRGAAIRAAAILAARRPRWWCAAGALGSSGYFASAGSRASAIA
jgi:4-diphosphocytidyl-2-C-methyl-D-erythritol kinase